MKTFIEFITEAKKKYYRGVPKGADPKKPNNKGLTWITPSKELAADYGDEVHQVDFVPRKNKIADIGEINKVGTVLDIVDVAKPKTAKQKKLYDAAVYHFGGGTSKMDLPKFLHKVGSEKVKAYLKSMGYTAIRALESGVETYGLI